MSRANQPSSAMTSPSVSDHVGHENPHCRLDQSVSEDPDLDLDQQVGKPGIFSVRDKGTKDVVVGVA